MTKDEIQRLNAVQPFEPFRVLVADGNSYDVRHPENFAIAGNGRLIAIGMPDHFVTLDLLLVTGIQQPIPGGKNGKRKKENRVDEPTCAHRIGRTAVSERYGFK